MSDTVAALRYKKWLRVCKDCHAERESKLLQTQNTTYIHTLDFFLLISSNLFPVLEG